jgi:eukaryotic-like serine/threonine-protein kinase
VRFAPYAGSGSGAGKKGLLAGEYDIGCTDEFFSDAELEAARARGQELVHIPLVMGAVVPTYNLPDLKVPLMFDARALAGIYLGTVTSWDDEALRDCNKSVRLPHRPIEVVYRTDESGTTAIWSEFLHKKGGAEWVTNMGAPAKRLQATPAGAIGASKNEGVAETVAEKPGRIGYVELAYALEKQLSVGMVKNAEGNYSMPSLASVTAAADAPEGVRKDLRFSLIDMPGPNVYPICGISWAVFDARMRDVRRRKAVVEFLWWATHEGQTFVGNLKYARLPSEVLSVVESKLTPFRGE